MLREQRAHFLEVRISLSADNLVFSSTEVWMLTLAAGECKVTLVSSDVSHTVEAKHPSVAHIV
jgi:hypothetical protein